MILVVLGHMAAPPNTYLFQYHYHMQAFFVIAGYVLFLTNLKNKILRLVRKNMLFSMVALIGLTAYAVVISFVANVRYLEDDPFSLRFYTTDIFTKNFGQNTLFLVGWFMTCYIIAVPICIAFLRWFQPKRLPPHSELLLTGGLFIAAYFISFFSRAQTIGRLICLLKYVPRRPLF